MTVRHHAASTSDSALRKFTEYRDGGRILDRPSIVVERALYDGEPIVRIHVDAAIAPPVRFDGVAYVRPGPTTRRANPNDELRLAERRRANDMPYEMRPRYFTTLSDLDLDLFTRSYLPAAVAPEVLAENCRPIQQQFTSLHLSDVEGTPTVLGLLVVGYEPRTAVPGAYFDRVNDYRNPSLAAAMKTLEYVNRFGRGITRIKVAMQQNGNPEPEFIVDDAYWSVALRGLS